MFLVEGVVHSTDESPGLGAQSTSSDEESICTGGEMRVDRESMSRGEPVHSEEGSIMSSLEECWFEEVLWRVRTQALDHVPVPERVAGAVDELTGRGMRLLEGYWGV